MFSLKIHLDPAEHAVISRYAAALHVTPEDIAYAGLDRLMQESRDPVVQQAVRDTRGWRKDNLPLWADTERSVHAYEGGSDDQPEERFQY